MKVCLFSALLAIGSVAFAAGSPDSGFVAFAAGSPDSGFVAFAAGSPDSGFVASVCVRAERPLERVGETSRAVDRPLVHFGTAYYPEAWDRANWEPDLVKMKELGVDLVRLGEFNWSGFEPREGEFRFDDYLAFLDLCEKHGLKAMMCTPTAAVPRWMFANYPGVRKVREDGSFAPDGIRHATCVHSPDCRRFCDRIVRKMAETFREHPAVVMWQIDNELSIRGATGLCVCTNCQQPSVRRSAGGTGRSRTSTAR